MHIVLVTILFALCKSRILTNAETDETTIETTVGTTGESTGTGETTTQLATQANIAARDLFTKCFGDIGCVSADNSWFDDKHRPSNYKPLERDVINTQFVFIKEKKKMESEIVTATKTSLDSAGFAHNVFLFVLIHDFTSHGYTGWIKRMSKALWYRSKKCNILSVDWHSGAQPPYDQALGNARVVALELIHLLKFLKEHNMLSFDQIHLIGHGVGAHIAGYTGETIKPIKITGLDPSGPRFTGMPVHVRLDATDAHYVEVLHTDCGEAISQGSTQLFGDTDFYINNGENQPGCPKPAIIHDLLTLNRNSLKEGEILPGCSHKRSYKYYIEALEEEEDCTFLGIRCKSYKEFRQGKCTKCGKDCRTFGMGSYSKTNNGSYFLQTNNKPPFCLFQYKTTMFISGDRSTYFGIFTFIMLDWDHYMSTSSTMEPREFTSGGNNELMIYGSMPEMSKVVITKVGWIEEASKMCFLGCNQAIKVDKITFQSINSNSKYLRKISLCPKDGMSEILNGEFQEFRLCRTQSSKTKPPK